MSKKTEPKKKQETKASLASKLKKNNIPVPDSATKKDMQHRLNHWLGGKGFVVRLLRSSQKRTGHPVSLLTDRKTVYWIPNSLMAKRIIESKIVLVMGRSEKPSSNTTLLDVPLDYEERFGDGIRNG